MDTLSADNSPEYRLLELYHNNRKSRWSAKDEHIYFPPGCSLIDLQPRFAGPIPTTTRVPASAKTDALAQVADKLSRIVDSIPPAHDQVVEDCGSDIIQRLVELLKEHGDQLNEHINKDKELLRYLQGFSYNLFANLASAFIHSMVPLSKQTEEDNDQKIKIACTCEMTSRLSALDLQPMNWAMGFGARYVRQQFAPWIQQHGGWESAFKIDEGDEVQ